jgi:hypothetical protein
VKPVLFRPPYSIDQEPDTADQVGPLELMANPQHEGGEAYQFVSLQSVYCGEVILIPPVLQPRDR